MNLILFAAAFCEITFRVVVCHNSADFNVPAPLNSLNDLTNEISPSVTKPDSVPPSDIVSGCNVYLDLFANYSSSFIQCTIQYSRPLTFCQNCAHFYLAVHETYRTLRSKTVLDYDGNSCSDLYLNADRMCVIDKTANYIEQIFKDANCFNCFEVKNDDNGTTNLTVSNSTKHFFKLLNESQNCFSSHIQGSVFPFLRNFTDNHTLCRECDAQYEAVNSYYNELDEHAQHALCMDLVDGMNYTRLLWSQVFNCRRRDHDITAVLIISAIFSIFPVVFYVGNRVLGAKVHNKFLKQKRLHEGYGASGSGGSATDSDSHPINR